MQGGKMKEEFQARMLRIYFGESDKWRGKALHEAIVAKCQELSIAGAIVYRGIEGYGTSTRIRHSSHWTLSRDTPVMLSIIDRGVTAVGDRSRLAKCSAVTSSLADGITRPLM